MRRSAAAVATCGVLALLGVTSVMAEPMDDALAALRDKDYTKAMSLLRPLANYGYPIAQYDVGAMYDEGLGVDRDDKEALFWYTKAAAQGYANAQANLGQMYFTGQGVPVDYKKAFDWWTRAASQGNLVAQNNLGSMYFKGKGVEKDYQKAAEWYKNPAEHEDRQAENSLGMMYYMGWGVPKDPSKGLAMMMKAAEQGLPTARVNVVQIMTSEARSGNAGAMHNMGTFCIRGWSGEHQPEDCMKWYEQAAQHGIDAARNSLAQAYDQGLWGVPMDKEKARYWKAQIGRKADP
jgi:uncharacterized protein